MGILRAILVIGALLCSPAPVAGQNESGTRPTNVQRLLDDCEQYTEERGGGGGFYCLGMVAGAIEVLRLNCESAKEGLNPAPGLRSGPVPSIGAGAQAFVNWARAHPENWGTYEVWGMMMALTEAFPCPLPPAPA